MPSRTLLAPACNNPVQTFFIRLLANCRNIAGFLLGNQSKEGQGRCLLYSRGDSQLDTTSSFTIFTDCICFLANFLHCCVFLFQRSHFEAELCVVFNIMTIKQAHRNWNLFFNKLRKSKTFMSRYVSRQRITLLVKFRLNRNVSIFVSG